MKILHIASFDGNIGDRANHSGFYNNLEKYITPKPKISAIEIRDFYNSRNLRKFDLEFASLANKFDLLVIGGGGFWEPRWENSLTGTTIDISEEVLDTINVPILFNGIGCNLAKGFSEIALAKFNKFLKKITSNEKCFVTVRNDGSHSVLSRLYNGDFDSSILVVPDGGYSISPLRRKYNELRRKNKHIAICLGGDMPEVRFADGNNKISRSEFVDKFSYILNSLLHREQKCRIVFVPHIYHDLPMIYEVLAMLNDKIVRERVTVAPLLNGTTTDGIDVLGLYKQCDLVLGMRHHANICAIALNTPTIGIVNYSSHEADFHELGLSK